MGNGFTSFLRDLNDTAGAVITGGMAGSFTAFWDDNEDQGIMPSFSAPLEKAMQGMNWAYDNGISQPISTFLLAGTSAEKNGLDTS